MSTGFPLAERATRPLRVALVVDPEIPVPPRLYGGIERIMDMLVRGLVARGHAVTLWAHPDSRVPCELVPYGVPPHEGLRARAAELWRLMTSLSARSGDFDVIHSMGRLAGLAPLYARRIPKIQTYQRAISRRNVFWADRLSRGTLFFTACSSSCHKNGTLPGNWTTVYNGVPLDRFEFRGRAEADAPMVFLGRLEEIKGPHTAIEVARLTGKRLILAGNVVKKGDSYRYFKEKVEPGIDGRQIVYAGEVDDAQKNELLGRASVFLMPIEWEEPSGIVMLEALACGTPVIGFRRGAVPETVEDGANGFVCDDVRGMAEAVGKIDRIDRRRCREISEAKFSDRAVVESYLALYRRAIARTGGIRG